MIEIIVAIVSGVLAGGLSPFLFFRQDKAAKEIENETHQSEEWHKLYEEECNERKERDAKIDNLYVEINKHRDAKAGLARRISELEVENTKLKLMMCEVPSCPKRQPKTGY